MSVSEQFQQLEAHVASLIVGQEHQVTYANHEARRLFELEDGLSLPGDGIQIDDENAGQR